MASSLDVELDALLSESVERAAQRAANTLDETGAPGSNQYVLFGAGGLGRRTARGMRQAGVEPVAFVDNNPDRWGSTFEGLPVLSPSEAAQRFGQTATFVVSIWNSDRGERSWRDARNQLRSLDARYVVHAGVVFWKFASKLLPYYAMDLPQHVLEAGERIRAAFDCMADDASRRHFVDQVRWRLHLDFDSLASPGPETQYFPPDIVSWADGETFIDVGGFDGDTLRSIVRLFGARFHRIVSLEPDPLNFRKLVQSVERLSPDIASRVQCHPFAVADTCGRVTIDAGGLASSAIGIGSHEVECISLDSFLPGKDIRPTFIKMDIEGAEIAALTGARQTIRNCTPILAIASYHAQAHLWEIPLLIKELNPDYRIFLRPHQEEAWDLICYAIPPERAGKMGSTGFELT